MGPVLLLTSKGADATRAARPARSRTPAAAAALLARRHGAGREWLLYEDAIYRTLPGLIDARVRALTDTGLAAAPADRASESATPLKRQALACYASQLRALTTPGRPGWIDALEPERYWRLAG